MTASRDSVAFGSQEEVLGPGGGKGYTTLGLYEMPLSWAL